jgi:hypothetical protein
MHQNRALPFLLLTLLFGCSAGSPQLQQSSVPSRQIAANVDRWGKEVLPGIIVLTGFDDSLPEIADPYETQLTDSILISGTGNFSLKFRSLEDIRHGGPYRVAWNDYFDDKGSPLGSGESWDLKPTLWINSQAAQPKLFDPAHDKGSPLKVWYGGHMRRETAGAAQWPQDNYSRDVFAFLEKNPGEWFSFADSLFAQKKDWPRAAGSYLGHRYGHQISAVPRIAASGIERVPAVFFEEVTAVRSDGSPSMTEIFMDEMQSPYLARGAAVELISPINPVTGAFYPSTIREDGSALVEGPLYFRFRFENEDWEAIGFSAGSYYAKYPSAFASRRVLDGLEGKPYQLDLTDDGTDLHDAGASLGQLLKMTGGPGRPAVIVDAQGNAIPTADGSLQLLVHGYRHDVPGPNYRVVIYATLKVKKKANGSLRFDIPVTAQPLREPLTVEQGKYTPHPLESRKLFSQRSGLAF